VLDINAHWIHQSGSQTSCATSSGLDPSLCPDKVTCSQNCVVEGITDYSSFGVTTSGDALTLRQFLTQNGQIYTLRPRVYLLAEDGTNYKQLQLLNQEIAFDVDASKLPCGMNGALYLSEIHPSGGRSSLNPAGAAYGAGYCDAQCFAAPWINGEANTAAAGACCPEMDLWEANSRSTLFSPHPCATAGLYACTGSQCYSVCDGYGCTYNPYALGARDYYGYGLTVDTSKPITVVTQFVTADNTATGTLTQIRRLYIQDGRVVGNGAVAMTEAFCTWASTFEALGGMARMGEALGRGMVPVFSLWDDPKLWMQWLDSDGAGPCGSSEGDPNFIRANYPNTAVTFSRIRWGDIDSTYSA
jgi:cellulase